MDHYPNNSSEVRIRKQNERLENLKGKRIFSFMEGVDEQIAQEIYRNFLSEPHEQTITSIFTLLEHSQVPEKSKEFLDWKNERLWNPPEDLQTLLSEDDYDFIKKKWRKGDFTYIGDILTIDQHIDCMASFKESLKYLPLISKKSTKNNNLFLQAEGKRLIIKYIDELKKIDALKRGERIQRIFNYPTEQNAQLENHHVNVHGATGSSQGLGQSGSRIKIHNQLECKEYRSESDQDYYRLQQKAGLMHIGMPVSAKSGKKDEITNASRPQDVKTDSASRTDLKSKYYQKEKSKNEKISSEITHFAQGGLTISDISENQKLGQERHSVRTPPTETIKAERSDEKKEKEITILLLGETGAGKTTFINGLANYIRDLQFDTALKSRPRILTDIVFTITDDKHELAEIKEMGEENGPTDEILRPGQSCTQDPKIHRLAWDRNGERINVNVIDTPGMNDIRGFDQDKRNVDKIFEYLKKYQSLNSICFVMKPNESKLKPSFVYCLNRFLSYFHSNVANNIIFCFTNTRPLLYQPGDTLTLLDLYLKELWDTEGIKIKLDRSNTFCFDNDSFCYLLALNSRKLERNDDDYILFSGGWEHNVGESHRFLVNLQQNLAEVKLEIITEDQLVIYKEEFRDGGQAYITKGRFKKCQQFIAIKRFKPGVQSAGPELSAYQREINSFLRISTNQSRNEHIVAIYGELKLENVIFKETALVMEWMDTDLYRILHEDARPFTKNQAFHLLKQAANGIIFLHENGIIHRDINPRNLLVDATWKRLKICDFGISRFETGCSSKYTPEVGTFCYMAPEVIATKSYSVTADVYSFTITAYEAIFRRKPIVLLNRIVDGARPTFEENDCIVIQNVLNRGWEADPKKRPTMRQLKLFFNLVDGTEEIPFSVRNSTFSLPTEVLESTETPSDALPSIEPPAMPAEEAPIEFPSIEVVIPLSTDQLPAFTPLVLERSDSNDTTIIEEDPFSDETESDSDSNGTLIGTIDHNTLSDREELVYIPLVLESSDSDDTIVIEEDPSSDETESDSNETLNRAQRLPAHNIQDTLSLNVDIRLLAQLAKPLAEIARVHLVNMKLTDDHIAELRKYNPNDMRAAPLQRQIVVLKFNKLKKPRTICKSSKCTTWKTINTYDSVPIYKICHEECILKDFPEGDNTALYSCNIFRHQYGGHYQGGFLKHCRKCGCHFTEHKHTFYEQRATTQIVEDKKALMEHQDAKLKAEKVKKEIEELEDSKKAMELEHDLIRDFCAEAAVFLHHNSMKSTADPYKIVLDEIIADEKNKAAISGNNDMFYAVQALQVMCTERFEQISSEIAKNRRGPLTSDEIKKRIINLSLQKICGNEVENLMTICKEITKDTSNNNYINK